MPTLCERLREYITGAYDSTEIRLEEHFDVTPEDDDGYWVEALVYVSRHDLNPNQNLSYTVWWAEDFSGGSWTDYSDWQVDEVYQLESDTDDGAGARQAAHERAKYLRKHYRHFRVAVRPTGSPCLPIRPGGSR